MNSTRNVIRSIPANSGDRKNGLYLAATGGLTALLCAVMQASAGAQDAPEDRFEAYVHAVTRGADWMPWQSRDGVSEVERAFRAEIERRKDALLASRMQQPHPVLLSPSAIERARTRIEQTEWGQSWFARHKALADYMLEQPPGWIEHMVPELTPWHGYGFTCPNCVGKASQEALGHRNINWSYRTPDEFSCRACGTTFPNPDFPETARLVCPRSGQSFTFYENDAQRAEPGDKSGGLAYHWVGRPMHVSFTGIVRQSKIEFMIGAVRSPALAYLFTGDAEYARLTGRMLERLAHCYRNWLYHDYWDTVADCDPMYAAWHDMDLPLEWKRHLTEQAYRNDSADSARMLQTYWGAGRIHPSTDAITRLSGVVEAYDLIAGATDVDGAPILSSAQRARIERDLLLEWVMGAEPYAGGPGEATNSNNKAPRIYHAMASLGQVLGIPLYADTALRGYEAVRDESFLGDGFSVESPAYTNMYLATLLEVPERLHGFEWPEGFNGRGGTVDLFASDPMLELMMRAVLETLRPGGRYLPIEDTNALATPGRNILDIGLKRYPNAYEPAVAALFPDLAPNDYTLFHLDPVQETSGATLQFPETYFPEWMTAIFRHGAGPDAELLSLNFSPPGGHRHLDNLSLFYTAGEHTVLADLGYVGDMPVNSWIRSTLSHNLVVVDGAEQTHTNPPRTPRTELLFTGPAVSAVEAATDAYLQCSTYRRTVLLLKGPAGRTVAVDIFRVRGGNEHRYRVASGLASSDAGAAGSLQFQGLELPPEPPLPDVGASLDRNDIFGLRDVRAAEAPAPAWQATWSEAAAAYRLWMASPLDRVEAANGPGQQSHQDHGRRLRFVDAVRSGQDLASTFAAVHEPRLNGEARVRSVERIETPAAAGPDALALRIETAWGTYLILNEFAAISQIEGVEFSGKLGIFAQPDDNAPWLLGAGASTLRAGDFGYTGAAPAWEGEVRRANGFTLEVDASIPADWPAPGGPVQRYVLVDNGDHQTGYPVAKIRGATIEIERFPLSRAMDFRLPLVWYAEKQ